MNLSEADTVRFAELYRAHECLWRANHTRRNKLLAQKALERIVQVMNIQGFGVIDAKTQISNLKGAFNNELTKIEMWRISGQSYVPIADWFPIMEDIMERSRDMSETWNYWEATHTNDDEDEYNEPDVQQTPHPALSAEASANCQCPRIVKGILKLVPTAPPTGVEPQTTTPLSSDSHRENDEIETFARYVAIALHKLPSHQAVLAQQDIQSVLTRYRCELPEHDLGPADGPAERYNQIVHVVVSNAMNEAWRLCSGL